MTLPAVESVTQDAALPGMADNQVDYRFLSLGVTGGDTNPAIAEILARLEQGTPSGVTSYLTGKAVVDDRTDADSHGAGARQHALAGPLELVGSRLV